MNSSDIIKKKQNSTLYKAYPNNSYNYDLRNNINEGKYTCGDCTYSTLKFTTKPVVCPSTEFYQGNKSAKSDTPCNTSCNTSDSVTPGCLNNETIFTNQPVVCPSTGFYQGTCFY
jgi:hypothetical protein